MLLASCGVGSSIASEWCADLVGILCGLPISHRAHRLEVDNGHICRWIVQMDWHRLTESTANYIPMPLRIALGRLQRCCPHIPTVRAVTRVFNLVNGLGPLPNCDSQPYLPHFFCFTIHGPLAMYQWKFFACFDVVVSKWCYLSVSALSCNPNPAITHPMA